MLEERSQLYAFPRNVRCQKIQIINRFGRDKPFSSNRKRSPVHCKKRSSNANDSFRESYHCQNPCKPAEPDSFFSMCNDLRIVQLLLFAFCFLLLRYSKPLRLRVSAIKISSPQFQKNPKHRTRSQFEQSPIKPKSHQQNNGS